MNCWVHFGLEQISNIPNGILLKVGKWDVESGRGCLDGWCKYEVDSLFASQPHPPKIHSRPVQPILVLILLIPLQFAHSWHACGSTKTCKPTCSQAKGQPSKSPSHCKTGRYNVYLNTAKPVYSDAFQQRHNDHMFATQRTRNDILYGLTTSASFCRPPIKQIPVPSLPGQEGKLYILCLFAHWYWVLYRYTRFQWRFLFAETYTDFQRYGIHNLPCLSELS